MFSKRIILILVVLFVLCFSLTCVSATQDNTTMNEQSVDENMDFNSDNVISSDLDDNRKEVDVYSYDIPKEKIARNGEISIKVWNYSVFNLTSTHYNENITGNISIQINDIEVYNEGINGYEEWDNSGYGGNSFNVPNSYLNIGDNTVKIIYAGDDNYKPFTYTGIMKYNQFMDKMDDEIKFKGNYRFNVADDATGIVNIEIDDEPYLSINATELGNKYFNFEDLSLGKHNYKITYSDDEKYKLDNAIEGEFNLTTRVSVYHSYSIPRMKTGDEGTISVIIFSYESRYGTYYRYNEGITGNISIYINNKKAYNEEIDLFREYHNELSPSEEYGGNYFKIPNSLLNLGNNTVRIEYAGDENYKPFSHEGNVYYNTFLDIQVDKEVRLYYDYIDFNIADDATGIVKIEIDNKTYVTINAVELRKKSNKIYFDDLSFGKHTYKITYSDDEKYKFEDSFEGEFNLTYNFKVTLYKNKNGMADVNIILPLDAKNEVLISYNGKNISVLPKAKQSTDYYDDDNIDITLDDLKNGKNEISFTYMDDKYPKKTIVKHFYVNPFTVPENPSFNDVISIYLPDAKGNFLVYERGNYNYETNRYDKTLLANISLKDGKANFSLSKLKIDSNILYLGYEGADVDAFFDAKDNFNYNSITISPFIVPENPSFNDVISIYLPDAKGNFLVYEQGDYNYETHGYDKTLLANTSLKDGKANFSLSKLKIGYQNLLIAYEGDDINNYLQYETSSNIYKSNEYIRINPIVEYPQFMLAHDDTNYIKVTLPENNENIINITIRSYEDYEYNNIKEVYNDVIRGTVNIPIPKLESGEYSIRINYGDDSWSYDVYVFNQTIDSNWIHLISEGYYSNGFYYEFYVDDSLCDSGNFHWYLELYLNEILSDVVYGNHSWELKVIDKYYNKTIATGNFSINWLDFPDTINREGWISLSNLNEKEGYYTLFIDGKFYDADFLDYSIKISNLTAGFHTYEVTCWDENNIKKLSQNGLFNFTLNYDEIDEPENPDDPEPVDDDSEMRNNIIIEKENNEIKSIQYIYNNHPVDATNLVVYPIRYVETYYEGYDMGYDYEPDYYYYHWVIYGDPIQNVTIVDGHANITLKDFKPGTYDLRFSFEGNYTSGYDDDIHFKISPKIIPKNIILPKELSSDGTFEVTLELPENSKGTISIWEYDNKSPVSLYPFTVKDEFDWRLNQLIKTNYSSDNKTIIIPNIGRYFEENSTVCLLLEYDDEKYGKYVTNFTLTTPAVISDDVGGKIIVSKNTSSNTLDVSLPNNESGNILVIIGNKTIYSNVKNGAAKIDLSNISEGYYDVSVKYLDGDFENFEHVNLTISKNDSSVENNNYTNNTNSSNQSNDSSKEKTKVKPKIIAKKKTFSKSKKVKRYVISLKVGKKPVKKVRLYLKMGKKTFKAKTNNKGKAIFKIKLKKKGTYKSIIKFNGNKLYHAVSKKVTIKIK